MRRVPDNLQTFDILQAERIPSTVNKLKRCNWGADITSPHQEIEDNLRFKIINTNLSRNLQRM
jgi:hypothetical protein